MTIQIEDRPVAGDTMLAEAKALLPTLREGQSFVLPISYASAIRNYAQRVPGKFKTVTEGDEIRIGRVA